jgi:hypothetical protein
LRERTALLPPFLHSRDIGYNSMIDAELLTIPLAAAPAMLVVLVGISHQQRRRPSSPMWMRFAAVTNASTNGNLWRAELHRVEEVLDARLTHLEDRI